MNEEKKDLQEKNIETEGIEENGVSIENSSEVLKKDNLQVSQNENSINIEKENKREMIEPSVEEIKQILKANGNNEQEAQIKNQEPLVNTNIEPVNEKNISDEQNIGVEKVEEPTPIVETKENNEQEGQIKSQEPLVNTNIEPVSGPLSEPNINQQMETPTFTPIEQELASVPLNTTESTPQPILNNEEKRESKKGKNKVGPILLGILIIICVALAVLYFFFNNSKNLFLSAINKEYTELERKIEPSKSKYDAAKNSTLTTTANFNIKTEVDANILGSEVKTFADELNKISGGYIAALDYKNKKFAVATQFNYDNEDMMTLNFYGQEKSIYIRLKNLFSKYIHVPTDQFDALFEDKNASLDDAKYISKTAKDAFLSSLEAKDFKNEKETIQIGDKKEKTKKISYTINNQNILKVASKTVETLKNDKSFITVLAKYSDKKEQEIRKEFEEFISECKKQDVSKSTNEIILSVYFKGITNKALKYEATIKTGSDNVNLSYIKQENEKTFDFSKNGKKFMTLVNKKENSKNTNTTISFPSYSLEGTIHSTKDNDNVTYDISLKDTNNTFQLSGKMSAKETGREKNYKGNTNAAFDLKIGNQKVFALTSTLDYKTEIGKEVTIPDDLKNSIELEDITVVEQREIEENIMKNSVLMKFVNEISKIGNNTNAYNE